ARLPEPFHGAVWFVPLPDLSDPGQIAGQVRAALGLAHLPGDEPLEQTVEFLVSSRPGAPRPSLVILDNFEQLVPGGVPVVRALLHRVEDVTLLVTSRHRLSVAGERELALAQLLVPPATPLLAG